VNRRISISGSILAAACLLCIAGVRAEAQSPTLSGVVRDSRGTPQIGAVVQLLRPDFSVALETYTDDHGREGQTRGDRDDPDDADGRDPLEYSDDG